MIGFDRAQAAYENMMPPEPDFDCECEDFYHEDCEDDQCECIGHDDGCSMCHMSHGCRCDDLYESYRESRWEGMM